MQGMAPGKCTPADLLLARSISHRLILRGVRHSYNDNLITLTTVFCIVKNGEIQLFPSQLQWPERGHMPYLRLELSDPAVVDKLVPLCKKLSSLGSGRNSRSEGTDSSPRTCKTCSGCTSPKHRPIGQKTC